MIEGTQEEILIRVALCQDIEGLGTDILNNNIERLNICRIDRMICGGIKLKDRQVKSPPSNNLHNYSI